MGDKEPPDRMEVEEVVIPIDSVDMTQQKCMKCTRIIQYKNQGMICAFCCKPQHITCFPGSYTQAMIDILKRQSETMKIACCACAQKLPKVDPINSLIDESVPSKTAAIKQSRLNTAIKTIEELKKEKSQAEKRAIVAERARDEQMSVKVPKETLTQLEELKKTEKKYEELLSDKDRRIVTLNQTQIQYENELKRLQDLTNEKGPQENVNIESEVAKLALEMQELKAQRQIEIENHKRREIELEAKAENYRKLLSSTQSTSANATQVSKLQKEIEILNEGNKRFERDLRVTFEKQLHDELGRQREEQKLETERRLEQERIIYIATHKEIIQKSIEEAKNSVLARDTINANRRGKRSRVQSLDSDSSAQFEDCEDTNMEELFTRMEKHLTEVVTKLIDGVEKRTNEKIEKLSEEIRSMRQRRASSPADSTLNSSVVSPRPQNVNINIAAPPKNAKTTPKIVNNAISYAQALAASTFPTASIRNIRIVGDEKEVHETAALLKKDTSFQRSNIRDITFKSMGNITVKCKTPDDANKFENAIIEKYGQKIEIAPPQANIPQLKITNVVTDLVDNDAIEAAIREQNYWAVDLNFEIVDVYDVKANYGSYSNLIINTNVADQKVFLDRKKVVLGLSSCRVHEHVKMISCTRCQRFGHFARNCSAPLACRICGEEHDFKECIQTQANVKCINCTRANRAGANHLTRHRTTDERCPMRKQRIDALKSIFLAKNT